MKIKPGYTQEVIRQNVQSLIEDGFSDIEAIMLSIAYARKSFKKERPDTTKFPKHLIPRQAVDAYHEYGGEDDE